MSQMSQKISKPNRGQLLALFSIFGKSQREIADTLRAKTGRNITQQGFGHWLNRQQVPPMWCQDIVRISNGQIALWQLRPDIFEKPDA